MAQSIIIITTEVHKFQHMYVHVTISTINIINISVTSRVFSCPFIIPPSCPALCDQVSFFIYSFSSLKPEQNGTHKSPPCPTHAHTRTHAHTHTHTCTHMHSLPPRFPAVLRMTSNLFPASEAPALRHHPDLSSTPVLSYLQALGVPSSHSLWPPSLCTKWLIP